MAGDEIPVVRILFRPPEQVPVFRFTGLLFFLIRFILSSRQKSPSPPQNH
jgi:hypothetical protein